jgi:hypothetical protein
MTSVKKPRINEPVGMATATFLTWSEVLDCCPLATGGGVTLEGSGVCAIARDNKIMNTALNIRPCT